MTHKKSDDSSSTSESSWSLNAVDFFCGAGGLTKGLTLAGIRVLAGIDSDPDCRETYQLNNPPSRFIEKDLFDLHVNELHDTISALTHNDLLFAGCAPCQPFTKLNSRTHHSKNARLLSEFGRFVEHYLPAFVLVENVPGIAKVPGYSTYRRFLNLLGDTGYKYKVKILDAKDYGVPQTRNRIVLIASNTSSPALPKPTHGTDSKPYLTVADSISHLPPISAGEVHSSVPNHRASDLSHKNLRRLKHTPSDGGDRMSWPEELLLDCHRNSSVGFTDAYGRMWWDRPAPSITCRCDSLSNGRFGHPEQDRAISLREAACLQGFPEDYIFYGPSKASIASQIGNAVPLPLAYQLGRQIVDIHHGSL